MTNNNYILARWRDAVTDPPGDGWRGMILKGSGCVPTHGRYDRVWTTPNGCGTRVFKWLDVTAIPAIPREDVQAAMDRLVESSVPSDCECPTCDAIRAMRRELGVAPTEVTDA